MNKTTQTRQGVLLNFHNNWPRLAIGYVVEERVWKKTTKRNASTSNKVTGDVFSTFFFLSAF